MSIADTEKFQKRVLGYYEEAVLQNPKLEKRMSVYSGLSRAAFANELHSVLGTEIRDLPEWLESHYANFFEHRNVIVDFYDSYSEIFEQIRLEGDELLAQLNELSEIIDKETNLYTLDVNRFNNDWQSFLHRNELYEFSDIPDEFYRLRDEFQERRAALEDRRFALESKIADYEQLRLKLNELNHVSKDLTHSMNSSLEPLSS